MRLNIHHPLKYYPFDYFDFPLPYAYNWIFLKEIYQKINYFANYATNEYKHNRQSGPVIKKLLIKHILNIPEVREKF